MPLHSLLDAWRTDPEVANNVAAWETIPARAAQYAPFPKALHSDLAAALRSSGIQALYTHQLVAWECIEAGQHLVIVTGTASGKTLCYNLPVLDRLLRDSSARALYLFPTKALAQDQQTVLHQLVAALPSRQGVYRPRGEPEEWPISASTYDGDTPSRDRPKVRSSARVVISNPDMLHTGILPHHASWAPFFEGLRFVVIDEIHTYRGVFGSHVANVVRRLKRVASFYGSKLRFILTSATIANPGEFAERLIEEPVTLITDDGSPRGEKHFLIYNPPLVNPDLGLRRSALQEAVHLAGDVLRHNVQAIVFVRARRTVELILGYLEHERSPSLRHRLGKHHTSQARRVRGYRSGYLPRHRREIERGLRQGSVRTVVATSALELGIDIGGMDASLLTGYPGTIAATWQQAGRAGRQEGTSLAALIASPDPLDQFLAHHPEYLFGRTPEQALIDPDNLLILIEHLRCAAFELPFRKGESYGQVDISLIEELLEVLEGEGILHHSTERYFWMADRYPAGEVSLRSASAAAVALQAIDGDRGTTVGMVDLPSADWMVHPRAVYLHEGQTYLVRDLDLDNHIAWLERTDVDYYTQPRTETTVLLSEVLAQTEMPGGIKAYGELSVTEQVVGFQKVRWFTFEQLGYEELALPPRELLTLGYWVSPTESTIAALRDRGLWTNDPNRYGPNWANQRDRARARDGYRCQVCGVAESGQAHHVHHKAPFRSFSSLEEANQLSNLVTLCPRCHQRVEAGVRVRSGLSGLAFVLKHLSPLFLMCDTRDLGVHSDPHSPVADSQPAVVIYEQVPGGIGFSQRLFELHEELMHRAFEWVSACECADGCPSCVGPGGEDGYGGKKETLALLRAFWPEGMTEGAV